MEYIRRVVDDEIDRKTEAFNAVSIIGPKGCGKTRTAKERCKTVIEFQDEDKRDGYIAVAETAPKLFLKNEKPILFDEWQDAVNMGNYPKRLRRPSGKCWTIFSDRFGEQKDRYPPYGNRKDNGNYNVSHDIMGNR